MKRRATQILLLIIGAMGWAQLAVAQLPYPQQPAVVQDFQVQMYPNPAKDMVYFHLVGKKNTTVDVHVMDLTGQHILHRKVELDQFGAFDFACPVHEWERGLYLVRVNNDSNSTTHRLIVRN